MRHLLLHIQFVAFLMLSPSTGLAQDPFYMQYTQEDGLINNVVYDIHVGPDNRLFVATDGGLQSFNGNTFKTIPNEQGVNESVHNILEDSEHNLWCSSFSGKLYAIGQHDMEAVFESKSHQRYFISILQVATDTFLIHSTEDYYFMPKSRKKEKIEWKLKDPQEEARFQGQHRAAINGVILLPRKKMLILNAPNLLFEIKRDSLIPLNEQFESGTHILSYYESPGCYLRRTPSRKFGLYEGQIPTNSDSLLFDFGTVKVSKLIHTKGQLFVCTEAGLYLFTLHNGHWQFKQRMLHNYAISSVLEHDRYLWVSTLNSGILKIPNESIQTFKQESTETSRQFLQLLDIMYASGSKPENLNDVRTWEKRSQKLISQGDFTQIVRSKNVQGLLSYFTNSAEFANLLVTSKDFLLLNDSTLMNAGGSGIHLIQFSGNRFVNYTGPELGEIVLSYREKIRFRQATNARCPQLLSDRSGQGFYFFDLNGTYYFDGFVFQKITFKGEQIRPVSLCNGEGNECFVATSNTIYTLLNGKILDVQSMESALDVYRINQINYRNKELLISSSFGLIIYTPGTKKTRHFTRKDGLPENYVHNADRIDDFYVIATTNYLSTFPVYAKKVPSSFPKISLGSIEYDGTLMNAPHYVVPSGATMVTVNLDVSEINLFKHKHFKYRLNDGEWINLSLSETTLQFQHLEAGAYTLTIVPLDENGNEGTPLSYAFTVESYYYEQSWFIWLVAIASIGLIFYLYFLRSKKRERDQKNELRIKIAEMKALKSQMNPHFLFNSLNSIQELILNENFRKSNRYLSKFSQLVRYVLEYSEKDTIVLRNELDILKMYIELEQLRFSDNLQVVWDIQLSQDDLDELYIPPMLVQPFVENAFKHGLLHATEARILAIQLSRDEQYLNCIIEDNGIGREKSKHINAQKPDARESFGENAIRTRIELINSQLKYKLKLTIEDRTKGTGTIVRLQIPSDYHTTNYKT